MFDWLGKGNSVDQLIAKKQYRRASSLLRSQLEETPDNLRLLQQLADVLVLDGQHRAAVSIYHHLVDRFAETGFFAKAIAVAKKIQRVNPDNSVVDAQLQALVEAREGEAATAEKLRQSLRKEHSPVAVAAEAARREQMEGYLENLAEDEGERLEIELEDPMPPAAQLSTSGLFQGMSDSEALALIGKLHLHSFEPGEIVFSEGEAGDSMYLLASGAVRIYVRSADASNRQLHYLEQGDFFGEISLLTGAPRSATVTAASDCELLELNRKRLTQIAAEHPEVSSIIEVFCVNRSTSAEEEAARRGDGSSAAALNPEPKSMS